MEAADIENLKDLKDERRRLIQILADLSLENRELKGIIGKSFKISDKA